MFISQEMLGNALDALAATVTHVPAEDGRYSAGWVAGYFDQAGPASFWDTMAGYLSKHTSTQRLVVNYH